MSVAPSPGKSIDAAGRRPAGPSSGRVWVVEDSALEAEMAKRVLAERYSVELFADGPSMLERLSADGPPDLLVLDWQLPGMSGIEVCKFLRASLDEMALPILMLTVQGHKPDIVEGLSAGANDYVTKPYDGSELLARATALGRTRRLHEELWLERRRLTSVFNSLPACIAMSLGKEHVVSFANPELRRSWMQADPVGKRVADVLPCAEAGAVKVWDEAYASGEPRHVPALAVLPVGAAEPSYYNLSLVPQRDSGGEVSAVLAFAVEVTAQVQARRKEHLAVEDRERLLEETRHAWARAEQANRAKDEFLATVSHELRTPLNAIAGWVHLLQRGTVPEHKRQHALETIERNARAQAQLIDDLLDVSRIISGKLSVQTIDVDLAAITQMAIDAVRPSAEAKGVELEQALPAEAQMIGDRGRLQQVLSNLLVNAVKFTPRGGSISVTLRATELGFELRVTDTGQGIDAEFLPHIFDRFRQADATMTRAHGGLGLGLAIVRHLVEAHGGRVSAESRGRGHGASFCVELPCAAAGRAVIDPPRREPSRPSSSLTDPRAKLHGRSVLVVEDDADSRELLVRMLEDWGVRVTQAADVPEAMRKVEGARPDLVVSDIGLPGEDGLSFMRRLRALPAGDGGSIPAIALTAYARAEDRSKALHAGFDVHMTKPLDEASLVLALAKLL